MGKEDPSDKHNSELGQGGDRIQKDSIGDIGFFSKNYIGAVPEIHASSVYTYRSRLAEFLRLSFLYRLQGQFNSQNTLALWHSMLHIYAEEMSKKSSRFIREGIYLPAIAGNGDFSLDIVIETQNVIEDFYAWNKDIIGAESYPNFINAKIIGVGYDFRYRDPYESISFFVAIDGSIQFKLDKDRKKVTLSKLMFSNGKAGSSFIASINMAGCLYRIEEYILTYWLRYQDLKQNSVMVAGNVNWNYTP